ncbi:hypothetical protein [Pyruvatibacter mobilis]|uniref:hypothetical protein n=1 Tax=Pyruvatibacter mobilis TaxID=1712261 RepID=UPI003BAA6AA2
MSDTLNVTEKYRGWVDPAHKEAMDMAVFAAALLEPHADHLARFLEAEATSHSVMPIVNPTLYRDLINSPHFAAQVRIAKAALAFSREVEATRHEVQPGGDSK